MTVIVRLKTRTIPKTLTFNTDVRGLVWDWMETWFSCSVTAFRQKRWGNSVLLFPYSHHTHLYFDYSGMMVDKVQNTECPPNKPILKKGLIMLLNKHWQNLSVLFTLSTPFTRIIQLVNESNSKYPLPENPSTSHAPVPDQHKMRNRNI